jgi:hypothetical protein
MQTPEDPIALRPLAAYRRLGLEVTRADGAPLPLPEITLDEAFSVIVGEETNPPTPNFTCDNPKEPRHDNYLEIKTFYPDPSVIGHNRDSSRILQHDCHQAREDALEANLGELDEPKGCLGSKPRRAR